MPNIRTLLMAAAVSAGAAIAMPAASGAMPASAPVKMQTVNDGNIVDVHQKKRWRREHWRESRRWHGNRRWARYCDPWDGCYRRYHHYRYRYYNPYYQPYYGYYEPYRYYGPRYYGPGIGFSFRF